MEKEIVSTINEINQVHDKINRQNWTELNQQQFTNELEETINSMEGLKQKIEGIERTIQITMDKNAPNLMPLIQEYEKTILIMKQNLNFEKQKRNQNYEQINIQLKKEIPELYQKMHQETNELILRTRYLVDKVEMFNETKKINPIQKGATVQNVLQLLKIKEDEIEKLKDEISTERKKRFAGSINKKSIIEIEDELEEKHRKLELKNEDLRNIMKMHQKQIKSIEETNQIMNQKIGMIEENYQNYLNKSKEMIKELKKERNFYQELLQENEKDTREKRHEYGKAIFKLEEHKNQIKQELKKDYEKQIIKMEKEIEEKKKHIENLQKFIEKQDEKIKQLEQKRD